MHLPRNRRERIAQTDLHNDLVIAALSGSRLLPGCDEPLDLADIASSALCQELEAPQDSDALYTREGVIIATSSPMHYEVQLYGVRANDVSRRLKERLDVSPAGRFVTWRPKPIHKALTRLAIYPNIMNSGTFPALMIHFLPMFDHPTLPSEARFGVHIPFGREQYLALNERTIPDCRSLLDSFFSPPSIS